MGSAWLVLLLAVGSQAQVSNFPPQPSNAALISDSTQPDGSSSSNSKDISEAGDEGLLAKGAVPDALIRPADGAVPDAAMVEMTAPSQQFVQPKPVAEVSSRNKRIWFSLMAVQHGAAGLDAWSTRQAIKNGGQELNPTLKPFAHSAAIYPALQLWPTGMDYLGHKMMRSNNPLYRRFWWMPQAASTATFLAFGAHNLTLR